MNSRKEKRISAATTKLIIAYRDFTEATGRTSIFDLLSIQCKDKEKAQLVIALGELEDAYCNKNGWASTNPMVIRQQRRQNEQALEK